MVAPRFNYPMNDCQAVCRSSLTISTSHQHRASAPVPAHLCLHLFLVTVVWATLVGVKWFWFVSLMINDVEHLFICLLVIFMSLEKCVFKLVASVFLRLSAYVLFSHKGLYILNISPWVYTWLALFPIWFGVGGGHFNFLSFYFYLFGCAGS